MCGRFTLTASEQLILAHFGLEGTATGGFAPRYNIAPTQPVAVITNTQPRTLNYFKWGLIPAWAKDASMAAKLINARADTVAEKPSFRAAFKQRRCLIPVDGYYEWQVSGKQKTPYYVHMQSHALFAFAGLWEIWQSPQGEVHTCTVITTDANPTTADIHHRMPVIIEPAEYDGWLNNPDAGYRQALLKPYAGDAITFYPVSTAVNKVANDNPLLIEPVVAGQPSADHNKSPNQPRLF